MPFVGPETEDSPLAALGFDSDAQRVYAVLLRNPRSLPEDVAWMSHVTGERLAAALTALEAAALVVVDDGRCLPLPAEEAIGRLILNRAAELRAGRDRLELVRRSLPGFVAEHAAPSAHSGETVSVEVIRGRELVGLLPELAATAPGEMLWMRPDQWRYEDGRRADGIVKELIAAGRPSRVLYPAQALEEAPAGIRERVELGEQARVLATVPTRLAVLGTSVALLPLRLGHDVERVLLIRQEALVGALRLFFESHWERALSVPGFDGAPDDGGPIDRRVFLEQLSLGVKDEQIARALGISLRTVRRRVAEILAMLGVETRFQAGAEAVRRGWL